MSDPKPNYPYVEYLVTRNPGRPNQHEDQWFFNLESSAGTFEQVQHYEMKGWPIVGYGNLIQPLARGGILSSDTMADEHAKIKLHIDNQLRLRTKAVQVDRAERLVALPEDVRPAARETIASRIEKAKSQERRNEPAAAE